MIRQLITGIADERAYVDVASRALSGPLHSADASAAFEGIFRLASSSARDSDSSNLDAAVVRTAALGVLSDILRRDVSIKDLSGRVSNLITQLPSFVATVASTDQCSAMINIIETLSNVKEDEHKANLERAIPKLMAVLLPMVRNEAMSKFALLILKSLLLSNNRSMCQNHFSSIKSACFAILDKAQSYDIAAECLALVIATESVDAWSLNWGTACWTCARLIAALGIYTLPASIGAAAQGLDIGNSSRHGYEKALWCERWFRGYSAVLRKMLEVGCATGAVATDLSALLAAAHACVSFQLEVPTTSDPKFLMERGNHLSYADISIVLVPLKSACIQLMSAVLTSSHPMMLLSSAPLMISITSTGLFSRDATSYAAYGFDLISLANHLLTAFPMYIHKSGRIIDGILNLLSQQINHITKSTVTTTIHQPIAGRHDDSNVAIWETDAILKACETLVYSCGALLSKDQYESLEISIGRALLCLCKGVMTTGCSIPDRKLKRCSAGSSVFSSSLEIIRSNTRLQESLMNLALATISCPRDGALSSNAPLVHQAVQILSLHSDASMRACARRIASLLQAVVHPSGVPMPVVPIRNLIKAYEASREEVAAADLSRAYSRSTDTMASTKASDGIDEEEPKQPNKKAKAVPDPKPLATPLGSSNEVSSIVPSTVSSSSSSTMQIEVPKSTPYKSNLDEVLARKSKAIAVSKKADSDDDIELPELNIDAPVDN